MPFQQGSQRLSCPVQAGPDGAGSRLERRGSFFRRKLFDITQKQHAAVLLGEHVDATAHTSALFFPFHLFVRGAVPAGIRVGAMAGCIEPGKQFFD